MPELLKSIEKVDDYTVRFRLTRPDAPFLADLAMPFNVIQSAEYADTAPEAGNAGEDRQQPIGTGPFAFAGFQPDVAVRYRAFADYWGGKPADRHARLLDHAERGRAADQAQGRRMPRHGVPEPGGPRRDRGGPEPAASVEQEGLNIGYLAMNTSKPPFDDVRVRRAINMAIDKAAIIEAVYQGAGVAGEEPDPADALVLQRRRSRIIPTIRPPPSS